jgi:hypothetical protein
LKAGELRGDIKGTSSEMRIDSAFEASAQP